MGKMGMMLEESTILERLRGVMMRGRRRARGPLNAETSMNRIGSRAIRAKLQSLAMYAYNTVHDSVLVALCRFRIRT